MPVPVLTPAWPPADDAPAGAVEAPDDDAGAAFEADPPPAPVICWIICSSSVRDWSIWLALFMTVPIVASPVLGVAAAAGAEADAAPEGVLCPCTSEPVAPPFGVESGFGRAAFSASYWLCEISPLLSALCRSLCASANLPWLIADSKLDTEPEFVPSQAVIALL